MSKIYLLKDIDLDITQEHTIDFENVDAQTAYFESHIFTSWDSTLGFSYLRENMPIKCPKNKDTLFGCNYLMYKNDTLNKWFYCFITRKEYIAEDCTKLYIKTDPMQTFMFDYDIIESFVEREHQDRFVKSWKNNAYLFPVFSKTKENIETGDKYTLDKITDIDNENAHQTRYLLITCNDKIDTWSGAYVSNTVPVDPLIYYILPLGGRDYYAYSAANGLASASGFINSAKNYAAYIVSMQIIDYFPGLTETIDANGNAIINEQSNDIIAGVVELKDVTGNFTKIIRLQQGIAQQYRSIGKTYISNFANIKKTNFAITNKARIDLEPKLYLEPYTMYKITNLQGEGLNVDLRGFSHEVDYSEKQFDPTKGFIIDVCMAWSPDPNFKAIYTLKNYYSNTSGKGRDADETGQFYNYIDNTVNDLPILSNAWAEYYSRNKASAIAGVAVNLGAGIAKAGISAATGMSASALTKSAPTIARASGASAGGIIGMFENIANAAMNIYDIQNQPDSLRKEGNNAKFSLSRKGSQKLSLNKYIIDDKFKQLAFKYLQKFGYKALEMKVPNTKSRYYYNFIKTVNIELKSNIDQEYIDEIKTIYDKGITFWHYRDATTFKGIGNYDYENCEMTILEAQS